MQKLRHHRRQARGDGAIAAAEVMRSTPDGGRRCGICGQQQNQEGFCRQVLDRQWQYSPYGHRAASKRRPALPEVKTLAEQGIRNVDTNNWYGLFPPFKTPPTTIDALNKAVRMTMENPALWDKLLKSATEPAPSSAKELAVLLRHDTEKWARLIKNKNIKPD